MGETQAEVGKTEGKTYVANAKNQVKVKNSQFEIEKPKVDVENPRDIVGLSYFEVRKLKLMWETPIWSERNPKCRKTLVEIRETHAEVRRAQV